MAKITFTPNTKMLSGDIDFDAKTATIDNSHLISSLTKMLPTVYSEYLQIRSKVKNPDGGYKPSDEKVQYSLSVGNGLNMGVDSTNRRRVLSFNTDGKTVGIKNGKLRAVEYTAKENGGVLIENKNNDPFKQEISLNQSSIWDLAVVGGECAVALNSNVSEKQTAEEMLSANAINPSTEKITDLSSLINDTKEAILDEIRPRDNERYEKKREYNRLSAELDGIEAAYCEALRTPELIIDGTADRRRLQLKMTTDLLNEVALDLDYLNWEIDQYYNRLNELSGDEQSIRNIARLMNIQHKAEEKSGGLLIYLDKVIDFAKTPFTWLADGATTIGSGIASIFNGNASDADNANEVSAKLHEAANASVTAINFKVPVKVADTSSLYFGNDKAKDALVLSSDLSVVGSGNNAKVKAIKGIPLAGSGSGSTNGLTIDIDVVTNVEWNDNLGKIHTSGYKLCFQDGILTATNELTSINTIDTIALSEAQAN